METKFMANETLVFNYEAKDTKEELMGFKKLEAWRKPPKWMLTKLTKGRELAGQLI